MLTLVKHPHSLNLDGPCETLGGGEPRGCGEGRDKVFWGRKGKERSGRSCSEERHGGVTEGALLL